MIRLVWCRLAALRCAACLQADCLSARCSRSLRFSASLRCASKLPPTTLTTLPFHAHSYPRVSDAMATMLPTLHATCTQSAAKSATRPSLCCAVSGVQCIIVPASPARPRRAMKKVKALFDFWYDDTCTLPASPTAGHSGTATGVQPSQRPNHSGPLCRLPMSWTSARARAHHTHSTSLLHMCAVRVDLGARVQPN